MASELPWDRSTLLVRIMAAGPHLPEAMAELHALSPDAHERAVLADSIADVLGEPS